MHSQATYIRRDNYEEDLTILDTAVDNNKYFSPHTTHTALTDG